MDGNNPPFVSCVCQGGGQPIMKFVHLHHFLAGGRDQTLRRGVVSAPLNDVIKVEFVHVTFRSAIPDKSQGKGAIFI